ncbi:glycine-rich domain-containing protein [Kribbella sp. CA-293567]|uniref:glycine-rich domain-containing protein n=1 Tax=Kribbella sp. CA-293567 TaxID=3002436 RepID=UPI0022DCE912|nr:hypothetical protein [Kribbella sp. CA-293567]WBQ03792.1 hypothetical protein OX958_27960 [Kribbella sp. CA-293567]
MTVGTPAWLASSGGLPAYDATELRVIDSMYATFDGAVLGAREGVRPGGNPLAVTIAGSNWNVATGIASVSGILAGALGHYIVPVTAAESGPLNAADGTFGRKDIVVLRVYDAENGDATREAKVEYLIGTPSATPSTPAVPSKSLLLGTITVPKATTGSPSVVLNTKYTVASGGILPTGTRPTSPHLGQTIYNTSTGVMEYHDGSGWLALSGGTPVTFTQTTAGAGTWTKPANAKDVTVEIWGGGGAGGGAGGTTGQGEGGGGGGGGYSRKTYAATDLNANEAFTVGAGTTGGGATGPTGGTTTFKGMSATGGTGGLAMASTAGDSATTGGSGGVGSGGDYNVQGDDGGKGRVLAGKAILASYGGAAPFGGGRSQTPGSAAAGAPGKVPGAGGSGAFGATTGVLNGGNGAVGKILITTRF